MPERTPDVTGPSEPGGHPSTERLRAYLADELDPDAERTIGDHLESCARCVEALDELEGPAVLPRTTPPEAPAWDERRMRRAVRRTVLRTAFNAAALLLVGAILLQMVGWLVLHPVLVDRGDRTAQTVAATIDLPVMTIPGAELDQLISNPGVIRRGSEASFHRAVGSQLVALGTFTTRLGPFGITLPEGREIWEAGPTLLAPRTGGDLSPVPFEPERLGDGTAVTVELRWSEPVDLATADALAAGSDDLAQLWVGFEVPGSPRQMDDTWTLGYSACGTIADHLRDAQGAGFGGSGFRTWGQEGARGAAHALGEVRRATANLAALGWPDDDIEAHGALEDPAATAEALAATEPGVVSVVITGPTQQVAEVVDEHTPDQADLLELDFDRGAPEPCG